MSVSSIFSEAAAALLFNRLRSVLTIASLAWGVVCFVILYAYGEGFGSATHRAFQSIGQDLILVFGGQTSAQAGGERSGRKIRLDLADSGLIRENVPTVAAVSAELMMRNMTVVRGY